MTTQKLITSRDPKGMQAVSVFEAAYNKCRLDETRAQRLNERGGELQAGIAKLIAELSQTARYANEQVASRYAYPEEYKGPKPIDDQIKAIAEIFGLDPTKALEYAKRLPQLPEGAEGWFAVPSVDAIAAKHFPEVTDPVDRYCRAVQLVHAKVAESRRFQNYREGQITPLQLRILVRTAKALDLIAENQPGDILVIAAQLGMRHRGCSVRRAREVFVANEFGLGAFALGAVLLIHPEREVRWEQLHVDCAGDEFAPKAGGLFVGTPRWDFDGGELGFGASGVVRCYDDFGSASAFLPE